MELAIPLVTRLRNDTVHSIDFSVEEGRCPIPSLGPGGRRLVNLSEILNICRRRRSTSWSIKVLIDQELTEMTLKPRNFFDHVQILFKFQMNKNGELIFIAEGIKEKNIDIVLRLSWNIGFILGRNIIWSRRTYALISYVEFPMNMHQSRQPDSIAGKAPESHHIKAKDGLKKRACSMCGDATVVPEAIVNLKKRSPDSPLRKEESPQTESDDSVEAINPLKRKKNVLHLDYDTDALIQSEKVVSPESQFTYDKNVLGRAEAQSIARGVRKATATGTTLDGSKQDTFEVRMSNSSQMEPLEREGNGPDFHHHHYQQQQLTGHVEYEHDHPPYSSQVPNRDIYDHIFLFGFALLMVLFVHILLLGYKFTD